MSTLQVSQLAYPVLLMRYTAILDAYSKRIQHGSEGKDRLQLDETLCVLEVCAAMTIAPAVADAALQPGSLQEVKLLNFGLPTCSCSLDDVVACIWA